MEKEKTIKTKFGNAQLNKYGYYIITSAKEGNSHKFLHRLIFEDFYQIKLPKNIVIHHEDGNKLNNEIWNSVPMTKEEHNTLHHKNKNVLNSTRVKMSANNNSSGYFRVNKSVGKSYKQGYTWRYSYMENGVSKSIVSVDLEKLKEKVLAKGLDWFKLDEVVEV